MPPPLSLSAVQSDHREYCCDRVTSPSACLAVQVCLAQGLFYCWFMVLLWEYLWCVSESVERLIKKSSLQWTRYGRNFSHLNGSKRRHIEITSDGILVVWPESGVCLSICTDSKCRLILFIPKQMAGWIHGQIAPLWERLTTNPISELHFSSGQCRASLSNERMTFYFSDPWLFNNISGGSWLELFPSALVTCVLLRLALEV